MIEGQTEFLSQMRHFFSRYVTLGESMSKVLIIEDVQEVILLVKRLLSSHEISGVPTLRSAQEILDMDESWDLVLLDCNLPDGDGVEFFASRQKWFEDRNISVIFLTGRNSPSEIVSGYSLGAEDYITKPFHPLEFKARIEMRLQKLSRKKSSEQEFKKGNLNFNLGRQKVVIQRKNEGQFELELSAFEFKLLLYLAKNEDQVLSRDQLMDAVWGRNVNVMDRTIDSHMSHLRKKLKNSGYQIKSVYGSGYRFEIEEKKSNQAA